MKVFVLLAATTFSYISYAQASQVPDATATPADCLAWAQTFEGDAFQAASDRCNALANCQENQSNDKTALTECFYEAETAYRKAGQSQNAGGASTEVQSDVVTEVPNSAFDTKPGGEHKGFENATEGD